MFVPEVVLNILQKCARMHTHPHTYTEREKRWWWETPVAVRQHWCWRWTNRVHLLTLQIYECYSSSVHVYVWECVYSCWDSPWLNQASYTFTSSNLHHLFSPWKRLMSSLTSLHPPWLSHRTEGEEKEWRKCRLYAIIHSSLPWECEKNGGPGSDK